uniref:Uncharacterized protein n=1 Tax=Panagrolaimus superbus TaxID=310955 RepID=A0A914Z9A4_9BILA
MQQVAPEDLVEKAEKDKVVPGNGSGAAAGVVAIDGGGSGKFGIGNAGKKGNAGGNGNFGGEGNTNSGLGSGNGSEGGPDGDLGKSKAGGPNGDGTEEIKY